MVFPLVNQYVLQDQRKGIGGNDFNSLVLISISKTLFCCCWNLELVDPCVLPREYLVDVSGCQRGWLCKGVPSPRRNSRETAVICNAHVAAGTPPIEALIPGPPPPTHPCKSVHNQNRIQRGQILQASGYVVFSKFSVSNTICTSSCSDNNIIKNNNNNKEYHYLLFVAVTTFFWSSAKK